MDYFSKLDRAQIWHIKQNKPTLIVHDLQKYGVPAVVSYSILLGRGVFKWFAVRRDLIWVEPIEIEEPDFSEPWTLRGVK